VKLIYFVPRFSTGRGEKEKTSGDCAGHAQMAEMALYEKSGATAQRVVPIRGLG